MSWPAYCATTADDGSVAVAETDGETAGLFAAGLVGGGMDVEGVGDADAAPSGETDPALGVTVAVGDAVGALAWCEFWHAESATISAAVAAIDRRFLVTTPPAAPRRAAHGARQFDICILQF